jgi:SAM-dependent methyltransferase
MKTRESGMPDEDLWDSFFSPRQTLEQLGLTAAHGDVADFGCGYGTFAIPAARIVHGVVHALDIDAAMTEATHSKAMAEGLTNVRAIQRDFVANGTGLPDAGVDYVMLFNILHCEEPRLLLDEAHRVLRPGGLLAIVHWNYDAATPRGPTMDIRPRPEQCRRWAEQAGFRQRNDVIDLPPYHYGLVMERFLG